MKNINILLLLYIVACFTACGPKLNGNSEQEFKISKAKIEEKLDQKEKENLEKALRVMALQAMKLKWDEAEKYKGKSFDTIILSLVHGLSYSSLVDKAEAILKVFHQKKMADLKSEIDTLNIQKNEISSIKKQLDFIKVTRLSLKQIDWFGAQVPELDIEYQYTGKQPLDGELMILSELKKKSTGEILSSEIRTSSYDTYRLEPQEKSTNQLILRNAQEKDPKLWSKINYPIENPKLADYDLILITEVVGWHSGNKKIDLPNTKLSEFDQVLKKKQKELAELEKEKVGLDELELTENKN